MGRRGTNALRAALAVLLLGVLAPPAAATGGARPRQVVSPQPLAYIVVDATTGTVLLADKPHDPHPPASTAKVMTALTAMERLAPDAMVAVSPLAAAQPASRINMVAGDQWPLADAMASLMMASANDAAYAIAETAGGGSLAGFQAAMTATGARLGMVDSTFADPAGFDDEGAFAGGPRMSAYDIAIATRNALTLPEITNWASMPKYEFIDPQGGQRSLTNHNKLLPGNSRGYEWATGYKTGYTDNAGHTLVATATRDGRTLIAVVLNTWDTYGWAVQLLEFGFATPNESGTGETLPDVAVSPLARRVADQQAFVAVARGADGTTAAGTPTTLAPVATTTPPTTAEAAAAPQGEAVDGTAIVAQQVEPEADDGGGGPGLFRPRNVALVLLALLIAFVMVRRRAVKRKRARRIARQRARSTMLRSGALPVVDGRYRTGTRTGPPVESHISVRRITD
ncbi:MAG: serine hydrolase [Acidimicrobiia bacterium]